jgi:hypothetical protein
VVLSFLAVIVGIHLGETLKVVLLITAVMLARLELQDHQWNEWFAFWILAIAALGGLVLGIVLHYWYIILAI